MKTFKFYGVCHNCYKLDDTVWEAVEDESDGYRSYLDSIMPRDVGDLIFFPEPVATVYVKPNGLGVQGFSLIDVNDEHEWLTVGTENYDDYYPCFRFVYNPKPSLDERLSAWQKFIEDEGEYGL